MIPAHASARRAFTLVELLVVMLVIGALLALLLPAVQAARSASRRLGCQHHLVQQILAVHNYETFHRVFPPGVVDSQGPVLNRPRGYHHNWLVQLLPLLERKGAYHHLDHRQSVYHTSNAAVRRMAISLLNCPAHRPQDGYSHYAGVHHDVEAPIDADNHGVFFLNRGLGREAVEDGLSNTLFLGEKLCEPGDLGWMSGTRATLRNTGEPINAARSLLSRGQRSWTLPRFPPGLNPGVAEVESGAENAGVPGTRQAADFVGGFASFHSGGANFAFGDASVRFLPDSTSIRVLQQLGHRSDGQLVQDPSL